MKHKGLVKNGYTERKGKRKKKRNAILKQEVSELKKSLLFNHSTNNDAR
jgi:hypothetical protein